MQFAMTTLQLKDKLDRTLPTSVGLTQAIIVRIKTSSGFNEMELILVYVEFGATSTDSVKLTNTYVSGGLTTAKSFNILARQISCSATWK